MQLPPGSGSDAGQRAARPQPSGRMTIPPGGAELALLITSRLNLQVDSTFKELNSMASATHFISPRSFKNHPRIWRRWPAPILLTTVLLVSTVLAVTYLNFLHAAFKGAHYASTTSKSMVAQQIQ